jgi:glutamate carboxypeptidase
MELTKLTNLEIGTTVNVGKSEGGIGANTISPKCSLLLELRYTIDSQRDILLNALKKITETNYVSGTKSYLNGLIQRDVMQHNSKQDTLIKALESICKIEIATENRGGVSDANIVASNGITTLDGFGPYGDGDHTIKERALKSSFTQRINMMSKILLYHQKNKKFH